MEGLSGHDEAVVTRFYRRLIELKPWLDDGSRVKSWFPALDRLMALDAPVDGCHGFTWFGLVSLIGAVEPCGLHLVLQSD